MNQDHITAIARKAINILFVSNPRGTSIGIFIGVFLEGLLGFVSPLMKTWEWANVAALKTWHFIAAGVIGMNLPSYITRKHVDASIVNAINYIDEQKANGRISEWQAKQMFFNLHQKVLESVTLDLKTQATADSFQTISTESNEKDGGDK